MPLPITEEEKTTLTHQVYSLFTLHGFDGISMNEVAKQIKLSKATIYKYFRSKEDIVRNMVEEVTSQLDSLAFTTDGGIDSVLDSLSTIYYKAVIVAAYSSSKFIADLESSFPDLMAGYMASLHNIQDRFEAFYAGAVREGYFRDVSISLVGEQVMRMLPAIITPECLRRHNQTLPGMIREYYRLLLHLLLTGEYEEVIERESTYGFVNIVVDVLNDRFLITRPL